jgi:hypothetical protein
VRTQQAIGYASGTSNVGQRTEPEWKMLEWAPQPLRNWVQELLKAHPEFAWVIGLALLAYWCYKVFGWVEDRLSSDAKQAIIVWLKSARDFAANQTLSFSLSRFHSALFGDRQLSIKCLIRTTLFSLTSFLLIFLQYIILYQ